MDDPSVHSEIDPDVTGGDNRGAPLGGGPAAGRFRIPPVGTDLGCQILSESVAKCPTGPTGIASVYFSVTTQPGDNFAIAASTSDDEIDAVNFDPTDGLYLLSGSGTRLKDVCDSADKVCRSRLLTVWRRLHIEYDRMPTVTNNHLDVELVPLPPGEPNIQIAPDETRVLMVFDPSTFDDLEAGRFRSGRAVVGDLSMSIGENTDGTITVTNTSVDTIVISNSTVIRLYDDDDFNNEDLTLIGDEGEDVPDPDRNLIQEYPNGDNLAANVLMLAYIRPVYDLEGNGVSPEFKANIDDISAGPVREVIAFDNISTEGDVQFWTVYLLNAYQPEPYQDGDGADPAGLVPDETPIVGFTASNSLASFIFMEPAGTKECGSRTTGHPFACNLPAITAREVARALGASEMDGGLLSLDSLVLSVDSLDKIRGNTNP